MTENARRKNLLIAVCLLLGGVLFLTMGLKDYRAVVKNPEVSAVVTLIETTPNADPDAPDVKNVYVRYTVEGVTYEEILQSAPGDLAEGQTVTAHYDPYRPENVTGATKRGALIAGGFGAALCFGFAVPRLLKLRKPKERDGEQNTPE